LVLPQFNLRLCAPTSTTVHIEVAYKFATSNGSIIQMNNDSRGDDDDFLRCFNVSYLSRFPDEDERLFFGGFHRIKVHSVRLTATKQNFSSFKGALFYVDAMVTAKANMDSKIKQKQVNIIQSFWDWKLNEKTDHLLDDYIYRTFEAYTHGKKQIEIDFERLSSANKSMRSFIVRLLKEQKEPKDDDNDKSNLLNPDLAKLFPNVKSVYIVTGYIDSWTNEQYSFSLSAFFESSPYDQMATNYDQNT